uniref:TIL domain containing protein n=1 Tax=Rhipicephalus zambeziensis TaxID=60191 RepID=A0A224YQA0_9ACAR
MHQITIVLVALCIAVVRGNSTCHDCGTPKCGPNEVPVNGNPRHDLFCRPLYTPLLVLKEPRKCVCKPHFVRNSWGECVDRKSCRRCKARLQKDWHTCSSSCPVTGNKPIRLFCRTMCTPGCDCPPGWVVDPRNWKNCVKAVKYPPICPPNSRFESCVSTCEPVCGFIPPRPCFTHCHRGACVCNRGFVAFVQNGVMICVRQEKCLRYLRTAHVFVLNNTAFGAGGSAHGITNNGGAFTAAPDGILPPAPSGHVFSSNVNHFIGTASPGDSRTGVSRSTINTAATSLGSGSGSGSMGAGVNSLPHPETGSHTVGPGFGGSTLASASGATGTVTIILPGSLTAISPGLVTAGVNGASVLPPGSAGTNAMHASLGAAGSNPVVGFVDGALSSGSRPAGSAVLSAGSSRGAVTGHLENTLTAASEGPGGASTSAGSALPGVYSGRGGITTGIGETSSRTPSSVTSGGIRAEMTSIGTHGGVHTVHEALSSGSRTAGAGSLSAGNVHGSIGGGVGNLLSHTPVPSSNVGIGAGNAHPAVPSVSMGIISALGGPTAHKPLTSQSSGVRTGLGPPHTDGGVHITPGTRIGDPGTSLASSSLLSATERMHTIRRSLVIKPSSARTPESVSAETSALPAASGIHESIGAGPAGASVVGVTLETPSTHPSHTERGAVNIITNSAGTTGFLPSATDLGAIGTSTGSVPTPLTGNRAMGDTNARTIFHGASSRPGVVGAGTEGTGTNPAFSAEHGVARVRLGATEIYPSAPVGSDMISLGAANASTAGSLSLAAPGLSRVGINTVSAIAPSSMRGIMGAPSSSGVTSGVSLQPSGISASLSTSGTLQPPSVGLGEVGLEFGAASSPSHGISRAGTVNLESRPPYFPLGTGGATVMTGAENGINVAGENARLSVGFSNVGNRAVVSTPTSNAPDSSGTPEPVDLGDNTGIEGGLTSVSRESGGSGILINRGSESLNSGARTSSIITTGHGVASGATVRPEGTRFGRVTGTARINNVTVTGLPPFTTLGLHTGTGSSYSGEIGAAGLPAPSDTTGSRDVGAFGGAVIPTNTHSTYGSGASVSSLPREPSGITGTYAYTADGSRIGPGGEVLPSAATSSVIGLGTYSSGVTTEGGNWNTRTTEGAHSWVASPSSAVRHGEGMGATYDVGQHFPSNAGYLGIGYSINPYLPGFMLNAGKDYADTSLTIKPADTNPLGGTRGDPMGYRSLAESEASLPGNMNIGSIQPNIGGATVRTSTSR